MRLPRFEKLKQDLTDMGIVYSLVVGVVLLVFLGKYVATDRPSFDLELRQATGQPQSPWNAYGTAR